VAGQFHIAEITDIHDKILYSTLKLGQFLNRIQENWK